MVKVILLGIVILFGLSYFGVIHLAFLSGIASVVFGFVILTAMFYFFVRIFPIKDVLGEGVGPGINLILAVILLILFIIGYGFDVAILRTIVVAVLTASVITSFFYYIAFFLFKWAARAMLGYEWGSFIIIAISLGCAIAILVKYPAFILSV